MKRLIFFLILSLTSICLAEEWPWEKYGLSQTEWKLITDNNIPIEKVEELLKIGVDITEYVNKPWEDLSLTEERWLSKRRGGMSSYDIELEAQKNNPWKQNMQSGIKSDMGNVSRNGDQISSLLLPGYQQIKCKSPTKGTIMASLAVGALGWCVAGSVAKKEFQVIPIGVVLIPDMLWSMFDYKVKRKDYKSKLLNDD